ncbi:MAG: hypothetical protein KJ668_10785, partial [Proteobacteria bacterium]|nr:hypothetical protein [Pseudomonadota bacterium]
AINAAFQTIGAVDPENARVVHIKNTLEMGEITISHALKKEMINRPTLKIVQDLGPLAFTDKGRLLPV